MPHRVTVRNLPRAATERISDEHSFHEALATRSLDRYTRISNGTGLGSALAICANFREAGTFQRYSFDDILITGIGSRAEEVCLAANNDPRVRYEEQNAEVLPYPSRSFDLVFCKEGLHHLARPAQGLTEMLRIARRAVILIEPYDSLLGQLLERRGLANSWERQPPGNQFGRDNYVYRWSRRGLESLLLSYYLDSGFTLDLEVGWLSKRVNAHRSPLVRRAGALAGDLVSRLPGARGNLVIATITPGRNLPPEPGALDPAGTPISGDESH